MNLFEAGAGLGVDCSALPFVALVIQPHPYALMTTESRPKLSRSNKSYDFVDQSFDNPITFTG